MNENSFAPIPNKILRRTDLSHGAKLCCARLIQYCDSEGKAYPKLSTLSEELGSSKRNVQRFLQELETNNIIEIKRRGKGKSNVYNLVDKMLITCNFIHNFPV